MERGMLGRDRWKRKREVRERGRKRKEKKEGRRNVR